MVLVVLVNLLYKKFWLLNLFIFDLISLKGRVNGIFMIFLVGILMVCFKLIFFSLYLLINFFLFWLWVYFFMSVIWIFVMVWVFKDWNCKWFLILLFFLCCLGVIMIFNFIFLMFNYFFIFFIMLWNEFDIVFCSVNVK